MATCPKCMGALTEHHRCPRGMLSRVTDTLSTIGIGSGIGVALCLTIDDGHPSVPLMMAAAALGAVLANAVRQAVSGKP
jgi:hypothetical protein